MSKSVFRISVKAVILLSAIGMEACSADHLPSGPGNIGVGEPSVSQAQKPFIPDDTVRRYIVRLRASGGKMSASAVSATASSLIQPYAGKLSHIFERVFPGFVVAGITPEAAKVLATNPLVDYIEEEGFSHSTDVQALTLISEWGLDWIDQRTPPVDWQYSYTYTGAGVHIYIVDSGVRGGHVEFTGRMGNGTCKVSFSGGCSATIDQLGHGTAVASQAAGTTAGVAKQATIHPVRIDDGSDGARDGDMIAGLNWVLISHISPSVVNLSYGDAGCNCAGSFAVRDALQTLVDNGITVVKSAGNGNRDAYMYRPNRVTPALVVAAAGWDGTSTLYRMSYSNYGTTVDLYAPGNGTRAATNSANDAYRNDFGGTSGASPFVAGVAAQILQGNPFYGSGQVESTVKALATPGTISGTMPGDPNLFLFRY